MYRLSLAGWFICCVVHVYAGHFRYKENYPTTGKGQEEIGRTLSVCLANTLTVTDRTLHCARAASFFQILCCMCSEDIMAKKGRCGAEGG